ncbi:MAG: flagellar hook-length control protein FliK [Dethiobacteraceae bacterium]|nr:hypothetical protein [Bacillota bacterium]
MNVQMVLPSVCAGGTTVPGAKKAEQEEADFWQLCLAMLGSGLPAQQTLVGGRPLPAANGAAGQEAAPAAAVAAVQAFPGPDSMAAAELFSTAAEGSLTAELRQSEAALLLNVPHESLSAAAAGTEQAPDSLTGEENSLRTAADFKAEAAQHLTAAAAQSEETMPAAGAAKVTTAVPGSKLPAAEALGPAAGADCPEAAAEPEPQFGGEMQTDSRTAAEQAEAADRPYQAAGRERPTAVRERTAAETERSRVSLQPAGRAEEILTAVPDWSVDYAVTAAAKDKRESVPLSVSVVKQLAQSIIASELPTGEKKLYVRLKPETLGRVEIRLRLQSGQLTAQVITDNLLVKQLLDASLEQLRERLQTQQITIADFSVHVGQGESQAEQQTGQHSPRQQQFMAPPDKTDGLTPHILLPTTAVGRPGLDLRA